MAYPLSEAECVRIGGHCFEHDGMVVATNPPIYHRICKHCGLVEQGQAQPAFTWARDSHQPNIKEGG